MDNTNQPSSPPEYGPARASLDDETLDGVDPSLYERQGRIMGKGSLVKAQFPDQPEPNISWFWAELGNCGMCKFWDPPYHDEGLATPSEPERASVRDKCTHPKITEKEHWGYLTKNTCPAFRPGISDAALKCEVVYEINKKDALIAAQMIPGTTTQPVKILQIVPWSPETDHQAQWQQDMFKGYERHRNSGNAIGAYDAYTDPGPIRVRVRERVPR